MERLDKGLIDFGIVFGSLDTAKYNALKMPSKDIWGVLMRRDSLLAEQDSVSPEDLLDKPSYHFPSEKPGRSTEHMDEKGNVETKYRSNL